MAEADVKLNRREVLRSGLSAFGFLALDGLPVFSAPDGWKPTGKPNLVFGALSDTHLRVTYDRKSPHRDFPLAYFRKALEYFKRRNIDALVHCGDLAHRGIVRELEFHREIFDEVFGKGKGPVKLFVAGNHEWFGESVESGLCAKRLYPDPVERAKNTLCGDFPGQWERILGERYEECWHREVKGCHFFGHHWGVDETKFLDFVKSEAVASQLDGTKPIFLLSHNYLHHRFCRLLAKDYPNAIGFFGHYHQSNADWRTIYYENLGGFFPQIELGACRADGGIESFGNLGGTGKESFLKDRESADEAGQMQGLASRQGMVVNVYDDMVVFERHEFTEGGKLGPDWVLPLGQFSPHPFSREELKKAIGAPEFQPKAKLEVVKENSASLRLCVRIPLADGNPDSRVFAYDVVVMGDDPKKRLFKSVYFPGRNRGVGREPDHGITTMDIPKSELPAGKKLTVAVRPLSSLGTKGKAIATTWKV